MIRTATLLGLLLLCACDRGAPASTPPGTGASVDDRTAAAPADVAPAPAAAPYDAALVLPGEFAEATSLADLQARFGAANVRVEAAPQDDGSVRRRAVLFPDDPARRAYAEFHDADAMTGLASLSVRDRGSLWRGKGGVHVGMSFADLRRANGGPFHFHGFDDEGRAWVRDQWSTGDDGRLGALDVGAGDRMYFGVDLGLRTPLSTLPEGAVPRDGSVSSDDPAWPRLGELAEVTAIVASTSLDDEWE